MAENKECPLCGGFPIHYGFDLARDMIGVKCERCGLFKISLTAMAGLTKEQREGLSSACRRASSSDHPIEILSSNVEQLLKSLPRYSPSEKLDNMLNLLCENTSALGEHSGLDWRRDYPLLVLSRPNSELPYLNEELKRRQFIDPAASSSPRVTMKGWERYEEISQKGRPSTRCFVAMWFDSTMNEICDGGIEPAIRKAGYDPLRIDKSEHVNRIDDEIIGQIRRSRFMVADFTGQRHGVYFEAGMMLGLGRTVIWMCRKKELSESGGLHFDVRQFNFIDYESTDEAKERLYRRIVAVEGEGPHAPA
ncbi:MAG: hypothetical protein ACRD5M_16465 [Candidatus Acidiferrales bacterium]